MKISSFFLNWYLLVILIINGTITSFSQCTGGTSNGSITPTASWQTICVQAGQYLTFSGTAGLRYTFSFCTGGGTASYDTEITILLNSSGAGIQVPGAYNDDYCGSSSEITFVPPSSNSYRVLITEFSCLSNTTCVTLAYKVAPPDEPCAAVYISPYCNSTYRTYSTQGATASAGIPAPGCASYAGGDVWFKTAVPFGNSFRVRTVASTITNSGMAIYKATSCEGPFTLIACNDDISAGTNNMSQIDLIHNASLATGDSVYIRFWAYNNAQVGNFGIYVYDFTQTYCMNGNPNPNYTTGCIQMTPNLPFQSSTIWNNTQLNLSQPFQYYFTANFGSDDSGADGITFSMQDAATGLNTIGSTGQALAMQSVSNSVIVEFDTYDNGAAVNDIADDHTAISLNGNIASPVVGPVDASATSVNIEDGLYHKITIDWNPTTTTLKIYFDNNLRLTYTNDLVANVFGGSSLVYWGFSSSTGYYTNTQMICPGNLPGMPLPVIFENFAITNLDDNASLQWQTTKEKNVMTYFVERSDDGAQFNQIGSVKSTVNFLGNYAFTDNNPVKGISYYRIKEMDIDGNVTYSEIRSFNMKLSATFTVNFYPNPIKAEELLLVNFNAFGFEDESYIIIYDNLGKEIIKENLKGGLNVINLKRTMQPGIYHVEVTCGQKWYQDKLIVIK
jgi:hypothetical protein